MNGITRRESLVFGTALIGAAGAPIIGARAATMEAGVPVANVKPPEFKIEKGASLHVLRPAKFVSADQKYFDINTAKFIKQTGIKVQVNYISWEDLRPQTAVAANTGAGPDVIIGFSSDPHLYTTKLVPMNDLAEYLGQKYGGWYDLAKIYGRKWKSTEWIGLPMGGSTGPTVYRKSWVKQAGYDKVPDDLDGFLELCAKLKKIGHPSGFSIGHALGDANGFCEWALWSHGGAVVDEQGKVMLDSKQTIDALNYVTKLYKTMIPGTVGWNDSGNNKAYAAGKIGLTFNGVSIYFVLKNSTDPKMQAMAEDTWIRNPPQGVAKHSPHSALVVNAMLFKHSKYPNAAKEYLRFMMEAPQYGPWLSSCLGYWSNPLAAYSKMDFWRQNPKLAPFAAGMDTPYYDGYSGPISAASSAVTANYTLVDMFASVATGNNSPAAAAKQAARQAARYYKT